MWDLPGPGLEPVSPALAGGFLTTAPPGKPPIPIIFLFQESCRNKWNRTVRGLQRLASSTWQNALKVHPSPVYIRSDSLFISA